MRGSLLVEMDEASEVAKSTIKCNDLQTTDELIKYYDDWANNYDEDTKKERGYICPEVGVKKLAQFLQEHQFGTDCRILDVGSGTGLVGERLRDLNYTNVDALEPSEKSNEVARSKGLYKNFIVELLEPGKQLNISPNSYDATISIGVFTKGNVKAEGAMDEMVRVVKPGGLICFSIREDVMYDKEYGYEEKMAELRQIFAPTHTKAGVMDEMVRVVKPGGLICFSIREDIMFDKAFGHEAMMAKLCENNDWKLVSKTQKSYFTGYKESYVCNVYQVL